MTNSYRFYIYRCRYCGTRTILTNDRYNPFNIEDNDDNTFNKYATYEYDIDWCCPCCIEEKANRKYNG